MRCILVFCAGREGILRYEPPPFTDFAVHNICIILRYVFMIKNSAGFFGFYNSALIVNLNYFLCDITFIFFLRHISHARFRRSGERGSYRRTRLPFQALRI